MTFIVTFSDATTEEIYAGLTAIDNYVTKKIGSGPDAYRALAPGSDARLRLMVEATRFIDAQAWQATAGLAGTTLQFPRVALTKSDGTTISDATQLAAIAKAVGELVAILAGDDGVLSATDAGSNLRGLGAGSARLDFFRPTSMSDGNAPLLPIQIMRLIGKWLAIAAATAPRVQSGGTDATSDFDDCDDDGDRVTTVTSPL